MLIEVRITLFYTWVRSWQFPLLFGGVGWEKHRTRGWMQTPSDLCVHLDVDIQSHWKVKMLRWLPFCGLLSFLCLCIFILCLRASSLALPLGCTLPLLPWPVASWASSSSSCLLLWSRHSQCLLPGPSCRLPLLLHLGRSLSHPRAHWAANVAN